MPRRAIGQGGHGKRQPNLRRLHVRKGDKVRVIRGEHAGLEGTILRTIPKENRVVIEGLNMKKRHMRPSQQNPEGGIISFEAPIHASNVMLLDPSGDPTRVRTKIHNDGRKERISVRSGKSIL
jgi:large subunit ribosomal protein L24